MSRHIVGTKTIRYLTSQQSRVSRALWVIHHQVTFELHATKGWRCVGRQQKVHSVKRLPTRRQWLAAFITVFRWAYKIPRTNPKWSRPTLSYGSVGRDLQAQMRHRERRRDIAIAANLAAQQ